MDDAPITAAMGARIVCWLMGIAGLLTIILGVLLGIALSL